MENNIVEMNDRYIKNEELGFGIVAYLTPEEVDTIARYVCEQESYADTFYAKCFLVLQIATDMTQEQIDKIAEEIDLFNDVFIYKVYASIENYDRIEEAIDYYNSVGVILKSMLNGVQKLVDSPSIQSILNESNIFETGKDNKKE